MRKIVLTAAALFGAAIASVAGVAPAAAYDYPWCVQGRGVGFPGDCSYATYKQCLARASGRNVGCGINPRVAFDRARRGESPYPPEPELLQSRGHQRRNY
jgi:hypothetical protein